MAPQIKVCLFCSEQLHTASKVQSQNTSKAQGEVSVPIDESIVVLGVSPVNLPEIDRIGMCDTCTLRTNLISSLVEKVLNLQLQINDNLNGVYNDLKSDFRTVVSSGLQKKLQPLVEYRAQAARKPQHYVFELRPVESMVESVSSDIRVPEIQPEQMSESVSGEDCKRETFLDALGGESDYDMDASSVAEVFESLEPEMPVSEECVLFICEYENVPTKKVCGLVFQNKENFGAHQASHTLRAEVDRNDDLDVDGAHETMKELAQYYFSTVPSGEVPEHEHSDVLVCSFEDPAKGGKCDFVSKDQTKFDAHLASHTLHVQVNPTIVSKYMPSLLQWQWKKLAARGRAKIVKCGHIDCFGSGRLSKDEFAGHLKEKHSMYVCSKFRKEKKAPLDSCLELYPSEQQLEDHLASDHVLKNKKDLKPKPAKQVAARKKERATESSEPEFEDGDSADVPVAIHPVATVSENIIKCSACPPKRLFFPRDFGVHVVRQHKYFACLFNTGSGTCFHSFKSKDLLLSHFENEHHSHQRSTEDSTISYLDPESPEPQCYVCGQEMTSAELYVVHMKEQHGLLVCGSQLTYMRKGKLYCTRVYDQELVMKVHRESCHMHVSHAQKFEINCNFCRRKLNFLNQEMWIKHARDDHKAFLCNVQPNETEHPCAKITLSRALMMKHLEEQHAAELALGPSENTGSDSALHLYFEGDLKEIPGLPLNGPAVCQTCSMSFENFDQEWAEHVRSHGWVICDLVSKETSRPCLLICTDAEELSRHVYSAHRECPNKLLRCNECGIDLMTMATYIGHIECTHMGKPFRVCDLCGRGTSFRKECRRCIKNISCDLCEKKFPTEGEMKSHKSEVHEGVQYPCLSCGAKFNKKTRLKEHIYKVHNFAGRNAFSCTECDKTFCRKGALDHHIERVHGERKFKCDRCDWAFRYKTPLRVHIEKVHEKVRRFICYICGGPFKTNSQMQSHIKKHEAGLVKAPYKTRDRKLKTPPPIDQIETRENNEEIGVEMPMDLT